MYASLSHKITSVTFANLKLCHPWGVSHDLPGSKQVADMCAWHVNFWCWIQSVVMHDNAEVVCWWLTCRPMKNTISGNEGRGFMKILVDAKTDTVIGVHMIGPDCAEIMQVYCYYEPGLQSLLACPYCVCKTCKMVQFNADSFHMFRLDN